VNNAGSGLYGEFVERPLQQTTKMLALNVVSITELTGVFAADMVRGGSGHILLVASLLGFQPVPGCAAYAASKAYALSGVDRGQANPRWISDRYPVSHRQGCRQRLDPDSRDEPTRRRAREDFEPSWNRWNALRASCASLTAIVLMVLLVVSDS
jgi:short chain dehydrogenase